MYITLLFSADVTDSASNALTAEHRGGNSHLWWENSSIQVQLPARSTIHTVSIQECASSIKFKFPPSTQLLSKVYELSCTCVRQHQDGDASAVITLPTFHHMHREGSTDKLHLFQASRTPSYWECNLTPVYNFFVAGDVVFNSRQSLALAKFTVPEFNCFICVAIMS